MHDMLVEIHTEMTLNHETGASLGQYYTYTIPRVGDEVFFSSKTHQAFDGRVKRVQWQFEDSVILGRIRCDVAIIIEPLNDSQIEPLVKIEQEYLAELEDEQR